MKKTHQVAINEEVRLPTCNNELTLACKLYTQAGLEPHQHQVKLICYPGWLDNSGSFDDFAETICRDFGFAVLTVDPPGCGFSDHRPRSCIYNDFEESPLIADLADALGWDKFCIVAHSRGGGVASLAAGMLGDRVEVLVCIDNVGALSGTYIVDLLPGAPTAPQRMTLAWDMAKKNTTRKTRVFATLEEAIEASVNHPTFKKSERSARNIVKRHTRPTQGGYTFTHDVRTYGQLQTVHLQDVHYREFLGAITAPTLHLLDNTRSAIFPEWAVKQKILQSYIKPELLSSVDCTGLGHHMHCDHPQRLSDEIGTWIESQLTRKHSKL